MEKITPNVYALTNIRGCNPGYVVTSAGTIVIDSPQLPSAAVAIREEVLKKGPVCFLINTENHLDHIFGNHYFAGMCPVIGQNYILENFWFSTFSPDPFEHMVKIVQQDDPTGMAFMPSREEYVVNAPNILFPDRLTLRVGGHTLELIHTPGHTKAQLTVFIPQERVLFTGDSVFSKCQTWFQSSDPEIWLHTLEYLRTLDFDFIIPGHGPIFPKAYIDQQSAFIREWLAAVAVGIAKGWSREECQEKISFLDRFPMDIGQEKAGPEVQRLNAGRIYDFLQGKTERFHLSFEYNR